MGIDETGERKKIRDSRIPLGKFLHCRAEGRGTVNTRARNKLQEIRNQKNAVALKPRAKKFPEECSVALDAAERLRKMKMNSLHDYCPMFETNQLTSNSGHHVLCLTNVIFVQ